VQGALFILLWVFLISVVAVTISYGRSSSRTIDREELSSVVITAIPVIVVAFYAMRYAPDDLPKTTQERLAIPISGWLPFLTRHVDALCWLVEHQGNTEVFLDQDGESYFHQLRLQERFRIAIDQGFIWRSTPALVLALVPKVLDPDRWWSRWSLGASVVLLVWSLSALITYSTLIAAVRHVRETSPTYARKYRDASFPRFAKTERRWWRLRSELQACRAVMLSNIMAMSCLLVSLFLAARVAASS
jgi:hypothetical protein